MCDFCHRHGEGRKWYLNVSNYSEELCTDAARASAASVLSNFGPNPRPMAEPPAVWDRAVRMAPALARWITAGHQRDVHWGQVIPIEDALAVVDLADWVIRLPCVCRSNTIGDRNARYCFGLGIGPTEARWRRFFAEMIEPALSIEALTRDEARSALGELDARGAMHSVWTFKSPYIGGLCNCDRDCMAYRAQVGHGYQVMYRAEYVARIDPDLCSGCRRCMSQCLFGAVTHSLAQGKCAIDPSVCYGCGLCRATCKHDAITLLPRAEVPKAAARWGV